MNTLSASVKFGPKTIHNWTGEKDSNPAGRWSDMYMSKCGTLMIRSQLVTEIPENPRYCKRCFRSV